MKRFIILTIVLLLSMARGQIFTGCNYDKLFRHPADCHKFLQCSNGYEYVMDCPDGLVFNELLQYCDYTENVPECGGSGTTTTTSTTITTTDQPTTICYTMMSSTETTATTSVLTTTSSCDWYQPSDVTQEIRNCTIATDDDFVDLDCYEMDEKLEWPHFSRFKYPLSNSEDCWGYRQCVSFCPKVYHICEFDCDCNFTGKHKVFDIYAQKCVPKEDLDTCDKNLMDLHNVKCQLLNKKE